MIKCPYCNKKIRDFKILIDKKPHRIKILKGSDKKIKECQKAQRKYAEKIKKIRFVFKK